MNSVVAPSVELEDGRRWGVTGRRRFALWWRCPCGSNERHYVKKADRHLVDRLQNGGDVRIVHTLCGRVGYQATPRWRAMGWSS